MKLKRMFILVLIITMCFGVFMPAEVVVAKGENDFTAVLTVSATTVSPPNTVVWTYITIKNTDPTYGCDVSVSTPGGLLISSFYLASGESRTVNHVENVTETTDIYYKVWASHGPDISKTKNTNTVSVTYDDGSSDEPDFTPSDEIIAEAPEIEYDPIEGVPTSGSIFIASLDNVVYDGMTITDDADYVISDFEDPVLMSAEVHCHLPDSVAADYLSRAEEDRVTVWVHWHMVGGSEDGMDEILEEYVLTEDDQIIYLEQLLSFNDVPVLSDGRTDYVGINIRMYDPLYDVQSLDSVFVGVHNSSGSTGDYTLYMGETYVNGDLADPADIDLVYGEDYVIEQYIHYTVPSYELDFEDWDKINMYANCHIDGRDPYFAEAPWIIPEPVSTEGVMLFTITGDETSFNSMRLDYGEHVFEIFAVQQRDDILPLVDTSETMTLNINVVEESEVAETGDDEGDIIRPLEGFMMGSIFEWLGFIEGNIELNMDELELIARPEGTVTVEGTIDYTCFDEDFYIRLQGDTIFGPVVESEPITPSGTLRFSRLITAEESTEIAVTATLFGNDGRLVDIDTEYINITVEPLEPVHWGDFTQRYSLSAAPRVIGQGESTNIHYSLSNEFSGRTVHLRLIDDSDGSIVYEDTDFAHFEEATGSISVSPEIPTRYFYTAQALSSDGTVLWEQTKDVFIIVMPNYAEDDGEESVFNLTLGASRRTIAPGEEVRIYGAIDYGSFGTDAGEISVNVIDQDHHTLYFDASCMPHDTIGFAETYRLDATTTFAITANGFEVAGDHVFADTDTITIVVEDPVDEPPADVESCYDMDFRVEATETIIAPGDSVDITVTLLNMGTEDLSAVVYEEDMTFFGDVVSWLHPDRALTATETFTFEETTTISLRACAWVDGDTLAFTETVDITIVVDAARTVDPSMPVDDPEDDDIVEIDLYELDVEVIAREMTIREGESTDIYIDCMNIGALAVDIVVSEVGGGVLFEGENIDPGTRFDNVLHWAPEESSLKFISVQALNGFGGVVYSDVQAVRVNVTPPAPAPTADLEVSISDTEIDLGDLVDIDIDVANTGDEMIAEFILSETLYASSVYGDDLSPGESRHLDVDGWLFDRSATIIFVLVGYNAAGEIIATDSESITITVIEPPIEEPAPLEDREIDDEEEEPMLEPAPEDTGDSRDSSGDASTVDDVEDLSVEDVGERISDAGIDLSLEPVSVDRIPTDGEIVIVKNNQEEFDELSRIYNIRRVFVILVILVLILLLVSLAFLIGRNKKKKA